MRKLFVLFPFALSALLSIAKRSSIGLVILLVAVSITTYSQNKTLAVGTATPNPNAALHVESPTNNQGLLMPRLTSTQRINMTLGPSDIGLLVYDVTLNSVHTWDGSSWSNAANSDLANKLAMPYADTINNAPLNTNLFRIINTGTVAGGVGVAHFENLNVNSNFTTLFVRNAGTNSAGYFQMLTNTAPSAALRGITNSNAVGGHGVFGVTTGTGGSAGYFQTNAVTSASSTLFSTTNGTGSSMFAENTGTGKGLDVSMPNVSSTSTALNITQSGNGYSIYSKTTGTNENAYFEVANPTSSGTPVVGITSGTGVAGFFQVTNASNGSSGVFGSTNSNFGGATAPGGVVGISTGTGSVGGAFRVNNTASTYPALYTQTTGLSNSIVSKIVNASNTLPALYSETNGTGAAIQGSTSTGFASVYGQRAGPSNGFGGLFEVTDISNTYQAIKATTAGTGGAAFFENTNASGTGPNVQSTTNSPGGSIRGTSLGNGYAGWFDISNASSSAIALRVTTNGTGASLFAEHTGASGDIAVFQSGGANVARVDKTGKGFFNGGTQASGADVAEAFEVEGSINEYEPGDVLVISETTDRTVEKSSLPNSRKVVGVYATKPGVLLTEKGIEDNSGNTIPMGVIGVIPTKVCLEGGVIKRGDLLVSSSETGKAMKAIPSIVSGIEIYPQGAIIGKALENFDGSGKGLIHVLVNVK
jgi:hypothetical protein